MLPATLRNFFTDMYLPKYSPNQFIAVFCATVLLMPGSPAVVDAGAQTIPKQPLERRCWLSTVAERTRVAAVNTANVEFTNLANRYEVDSPFVVNFAVRGMGVTPAGTKITGTGHHHLLINTPLPINVGEKIPFNDNHRHFGKGQTNTLLDLPAGEHKLRLLFADYDHRPYFVFSNEITIKVRGKRSNVKPIIDENDFNASCAKWYQHEVTSPQPGGDLLYFENIRTGETVSSPLKLQFGVNGWGVCTSAANVARTGHFILDTVQGSKPGKSRALVDGATQTDIDLPNGRHLLRLKFVDAKGEELLPATEIDITVARQSDEKKGRSLASR